MRTSHRIFLITASCIPAPLQIVKPAGYLIHPDWTLFKAIITTYPVQPRPHHPLSPASCILSHLSSVVSSLAIFIYYLSSSIFIKSPALPCIVHPLPLPPCNKNSVKTQPILFHLHQHTEPPVKEKKRERERKKKKLKESKRK